MVDETPTAWLVELSGRPKIEGGSEASVKADKDNFRALARANGVKFSERFEYSELWSGPRCRPAPRRLPGCAVFLG